MKKVIILSILAATLIALPVTVLAAQRHTSLPWTEAIYKTADDRDAGLVSKFTDGDTTCYVLVGDPNNGYSRGSAISCLRTNQ